jgi:hypothetical protein
MRSECSVEYIGKEIEEIDREIDKYKYIYIPHQETKK